MAIYASSIGSSALAKTRSFNIPAQPATTAIPELARQAGIQILISESAVRGKVTGAVKGAMSTEQALHLLLKGTGLHVSSDDGKTVVLAGAQGAGVDRDPTASLPPPSAAEPPRPAEIVVTAEKKPERLLDTPVPVTALNTAELAANGQNRIQDYFATVPGLSITESGSGKQTIVIRGLSTGSGNSTVAMLIDDVPFGPSNSWNLGGSLYPDIDPADLSQIEVLRGPQGTLYGADSIGGLINVVTRDPSTRAISGRLETSVTAIDGGGVGYGLHGALNLPLSETLAVSISGFTRQDPGYIDNILTGQKNINTGHVSGGHAALLWRPSGDFSIKLAALVQDSSSDGNAWVNANSTLSIPAGPLQQTALPGTGAPKVDAQLYTATITFKLGRIDFTSITGYGVSSYNDHVDYSAQSGLIADLNPGDDMVEVNHYVFKKLTEEFRMSTTVLGRVDILAGAFYTHESDPGSQSLNGANPASGQILAQDIYWRYQPNYLNEVAVFADATVRITPKLSIQAGLRQSKSWQTFQQSQDYGPLTELLDGVASGTVLAPVHESGSPLTYLVTPKYEITRNLMVYGRATSGYRIGGFNLSYVLEPVPTSYKPDTIKNYEIGLKGSVLNHALTIDASLYDVNWKNIQLGFETAQTHVAYTGNGGDARSRGAELSLQARPVHGLTLTAMATYDDAELTQNLPALAQAYGLKGDRLPYSSKYSASLTAEEIFPISAQWNGLIGGTLSHVGAREGAFVSSATQVRLAFPEYNVLNVHAGVSRSVWTINAFINNLSNVRGITGGYTGTTAGNTTGYNAYVMQPRTLGLDVSRSF